MRSGRSATALQKSRICAPSTVRPPGKARRQIGGDARARIAPPGYVCVKRGRGTAFGQKTTDPMRGR